MEVIFYSTHCPKCKVLKTKLDSKKINYTENNSVEDMLALGIQMAPALKVGEELMDFSSAVKWINAQEAQA